MKSIAFIFTKDPYSSTSSRDGLDFLLASANIIKKIEIFFIDHGIFLLLSNQHPEKNLFKNFIKTFTLLSTYSNIHELYICKESVLKYGLNYSNTEWILKIQYISNKKIRNELNKFDIILTF